MQKRIVFGLLGLVFWGVTAKAQQPLQADLNPANYTPFAKYYDTGSQQTFYYDNNQNTFFVCMDTAVGTTSPAVCDDQTACQIKANDLAVTGAFSHGNYVIGGFEGIGWGGSPDCATCLPSTGMALTGDAAAQRADGTWIRVRSWR